MTTIYPSGETHAGTEATCPALWDALRDVTDPELPISVVDMGLIVALAEQDGIVEIKLTFTAMDVRPWSSSWMISARACYKSQAYARYTSTLCGIPSGPKHG